MPLSGPDQEDKRKIHAEINQLANQRFLITTAAITLFGVIVGLASPKATPASGTPVGSFVFLMASMLSILLFALFLLSHYYKGLQRVYSTYLRLTDSSGWEADWKEFRKDSYLAYTAPQTIIFVVLNLLATVFPYIISVVTGLRCAPTNGLIVTIVVGSLTELFMVGMGFWGWFDRERKAEQQWLAIKNPQ
jgi:hypothetical protein